MAKYKNIDSALHNWAHSYLSIENYDEKGYFIEELYEAAKSTNEANITIDVLCGSLSPSAVVNDRVESFLRRCSESFIRQLQSQNVDPHMISSAALQLHFDFSAPLANTIGISFRDPWKAPKTAAYTAKVAAVDDRGKEHSAKMKEWWR